MLLHEVYLGIASNVEPEENFLRAFGLLASRVYLDALSTCLRTAPIGRPEQPPYINAVIGARTDLDPRSLKYGCLRPIEQALGRVRTADAYAARPMDLDILLYDSLVIDEPDLRIPDPHIVERPFLIAGLLELAPALVMPDTGATLASCSLEFDGAEPMLPLYEFTRSMKERYFP